jgi:putative transposase
MAFTSITAPRGKPHFGAHIERLIGTMMGAVHLLPGITFSDVKQKGLLPIRSTRDSDDIRTGALACSSDRRCASPIGTTPLAAWQEAMSRLASPVRKPVDSTEFFLCFLRRDGIHLWNIRYWDNVLSPWAGRMQRPLLVKYDPRNLSRIYVRDPDGLHWPVPYADLGQPPHCVMGATGSQSTDSQEHSICT